MNQGFTTSSLSGRTYALVVWGLLLASAFTFALTAVVGIVIAYMKRPEMVGTPFESHMTSAIRTFWISIVVGVIGFLLTFVLIGVPILIALAVWQLFRVIRGIISAAEGRPILNPRGWL